MKKEILFYLFLGIISIATSFAQPNAENQKYWYNKVYDYDDDTIKTIPFRSDSLVRYAGQFIGVPYVSPGQDPSGFDCSGFAFYCFRRYSIYLPYAAHEQAELGTLISLKDANAGDLIFFQGQDLSDKSVHHVAIVVSKKGEKLKFIHSAHHGVQYEYFTSPYYNSRFIKIKRVY